MPAAFFLTAGNSGKKFHFEWLPPSGNSLSLKPVLTATFKPDNFAKNDISITTDLTADENLMEILKFMYRICLLYVPTGNVMCGLGTALSCTSGQKSRSSAELGPIFVGSIGSQHLVWGDMSGPRVKIVNFAPGISSKFVQIIFAPPSGCCTCIFLQLS